MTQDVSALLLRFRKVLAEVREDDARGEYKEMAKLLNGIGYKVSANTVTNYEDGTTKKVPLEYINAVCRAFGLNHGYFFSPTAPKHPVTESVAGQKLKAMRVILDAKELSDDDIADLFRVLDAIPPKKGAKGTGSGGP